MGDTKHNLIVGLLVVILLLVAYTAKAHWNAKWMGPEKVQPMGFTADPNNWPDSGQYGALADTYPYMDYSGYSGSGKGYRGGK
jgi:hypothetical protein